MTTTTILLTQLAFNLLMVLALAFLLIERRSAGLRLPKLRRKRAQPAAASEAPVDAEPARDSAPAPYAHLDEQIEESVGAVPERISASHLEQLVAQTEQRELAAEEELRGRLSRFRDRRAG